MAAALLRCKEVREGTASAVRATVTLSAVHRPYTLDGLSVEYVPDPSERRQALAVHAPIVDKDTDAVLEAQPVFSTAEPWEGDLCPHEVEALQNEALWSRELSFTVRT